MLALPVRVRSSTYAPKVRVTLLSMRSWPPVTVALSVTTSAVWCTIYTSSPSPPVSVSMPKPAPPSSTFFPVLPVRLLASALPVTFRFSASPVIGLSNTTCSILVSEGLVKLSVTVVRTVSIPSLSSSTTTSLVSSTI